jgi:hypothetical protein
MKHRPDPPTLAPAFTCCGEHVELTGEPLDRVVLEAIEKLPLPESLPRPREGAEVPEFVLTVEPEE